MLRRAAFAVALSLVPAAAMADTMPQMDFHNPLTGSQVVWMVVILVVLYLALANWGLPQIGGVIEGRNSSIKADLEAARAAKKAADEAVAALNRLMKEARDKAQSDLAKAESEAKAKALADAKILNAKLDAQLEYSERQIAEARARALDAIKPVAAETAGVILVRLTGKAPAPAVLDPELDAALTRAQAA